MLKNFKLFTIVIVATLNLTGCWGGEKKSDETKSENKKVSTSAKTDKKKANQDKTKSTKIAKTKKDLPKKKQIKKSPVINKEKTPVSVTEKKVNKDPVVPKTPVKTSYLDAAKRGAQKTSKPKTKVKKLKAKTAAPTVEKKEKQQTEDAPQEVSQTETVLKIVQDYALKTKKFPRAVRKGDEEAIEVFIAELCKRENLNPSHFHKRLVVLKELLNGCLQAERYVLTTERLTLYTSLHPEFSPEQSTSYDVEEDALDMKGKLHRFFDLKAKKRKKKRISGARKRARRKQRLKEQALL